MKITLLGTGTSAGVPVIACECKTCRSTDPKNIRLRTSVWIRVDNVSLIIDTSIDFRQQALRFQIPQVDGILLTHSHMDHIFGLDEIRRYNWIQNETIPVFAKKETVDDVKRIFSYAFKGYDFPGGIPKLEVHTVETEFVVKGIPVIPIPVQHGNWTIYGFRIGDFAYLTDCNGIPVSSMEILNNLKILVLDALRIRKHPTHFSLEESIENARRIGAEQTFFTHISHDIEHSEVDRTLPPGMNLGYDGLTCEMGKSNP